MQQIAENGEKQQTTLNRRRFLATGAVAAVAGAVAPLRQGFAAEEGSLSAAEPVVEGVFPLAGSEGSSVFITGRGFDPDPENNVVLIGDGRARVEVIDAASNYLVGVIGPITTAGSGSVRVVTGKQRTPADRVVACAGGRSVATHCRALSVRAVAEAPASFRLVRRSPIAVEGDRSSGVALELGSGPAVAYRSAEVEVSLPSGATQRFEVKLPSAAASPAQFASHLAHHLDRTSGLHATARGSKMTVSKSPSGSEWLRIDLRITGKTKRGLWFTSWSGRVA